MYLKSLQMRNFRKYREDENVCSFVSAEGIKKGQSREMEDIDVSSATTLIVGKNNSEKTSVIQSDEDESEKNRRIINNKYV